MKKVAVLFMVILFVTVSILPSYAASKPTTLTFWTFQELHKSFMDDAVAVWNKANPKSQIVLKTEVYPYDEMHNKLLISLQSGVGAPDLADIEISKFANYLKGKNPQLVPLNSIVKPVLSKCIKARFDNYAKDGNYYGIDYHVGATVMYYNKEYMDKAGVNVDKIVTWDDYVAAGKKVMAATGKPMTTVEVTEHWTFYPMLSQYGTDIFSKDGKVILDNADNVKVLTFIRDMIYKDKIAVPAPGGFHHSEEYWAFMNKGGAASLMMPMWYMGRFVQYMPDLKGKIIIRPLPVWTKGGKRSAGMGGTGTVITNQSKNKALAQKFLAAAKLSKEGAIKTWTVLGFDPLRWDVWTDPAMKADNQYTDYFGKGIFEMLIQIKDEINPTMITEKYPLAIDLLKKNVCFKVLKEQSQTPEEALKEAAKELRQ
jgi:arabinosaccharide transport system substrate-binding protein